MMSRKKNPFRYLLLIPFQTLFSLLIFVAGYAYDAFLTPAADPGVIGHAAPVGIIIGAIVAVLLFIIVTVLALILTLIACIRKK